MSESCVFCAIVAGTEPAEILRQWPDAIAITPLDPVTPGHVLVIPRRHALDYLTDPDATTAVARRVAEYARDECVWPSNVIVSAGPEATQTVWHLHFHLVPRREGDGLTLPWTGQVTGA